MEEISQMAYDIVGTHDGKWQNVPCDDLGKAIRAAMANINAGWQNVRIECPDNTVLKEGLIREMHNIVESGAMRA